MRSGKYEVQPGGYKAFIPSSLLPTPIIQMNADLWNELSHADRALGRLDGVSDTLPNPDLFVAMYVRKEAVLSSQIEGTQASLADLLEFEAEIPSEQSESGDVADIVDVVNYVAAMKAGLGRLKTLPVSVRLIKEIHANLLADVRGGDKAPGELRKIQNWIGSDGAPITKALFVPPPPQRIEEALSDLEKFIHSDAPLPALIKVGLVHAQFETIHPFLDGNGRMGRLLIAFLLCEKKILHRPLLYLSHFFKAHQSEYYDRLQATRDKDDWEGWLKFFLKGVSTVAEEATSTARKISLLREQHRNEVLQSSGKGAATALELLEHLYFHPVITVENAMSATKTAYPNANRLIGDFVKLGILKEMTGQKRNRKFAYAPYLSLFD